MAKIIFEALGALILFATVAFLFLFVF